MSRKGKQPVAIPDDVSVSQTSDRFIVTGPKGQLQLKLHERVRLDLGEKRVVVSVIDPGNKHDRALWGLFRMLIANLVHGVRDGFRKQLEIQGVGFRAKVQDNNLELSLGFSHPVLVPIPQGITITVDKNVITVNGIDKQLVGEVAATIRRRRPPEPYKGKGIRYLDEHVRRKAGKVIKAAGAK